MFKRLIEFDLMIGALGEDRGAVGRKVPLGMCEKRVERGEGTGGQDVGLERRERFDTGRKHLDGDRELSRDSREESGLALVAFDEGYREIRTFDRSEDGDDHAWKAAAGAEVSPMRGGSGGEIENLYGIKEVPVSQIVERRARDKVDYGIPLADQHFEPGQKLRCFT